jgi:hypothetical membrane protein
MEWILISVAVIVLLLVGIYFRKKYIHTRTGLLIFFLLFLALIIIFTVNLINHFTYIKLSIIVLLAIFGSMDYYKRFKRIR